LARLSLISDASFYDHVLPILAATVDADVVQILPQDLRKCRMIVDLTGKGRTI
jgi:hypothetical protein